MYIPAQTHINPLCTIRRERFLPAPGEVLVRAGQKVEAHEVVARAAIPTAHYVVDISRFLGVPAAQADKYVLRKPSDEVKRGTALARRATALGLQSRVARSPGPGVVVSTTGGRVVIEANRQAVEVRAGMPGLIANVAPGLGVVIEAYGALIQGVWGAAGRDFGVLHVLADKREDPLRAEAITVSHRGAVIAAGRDADAEALRKAAEHRVKGIVLGSLDPALFELARKLPCPVVVTEGFGSRPMNAPAFTLLKTNVGREAALDGRPADRFEGWRPEVIIPLPVSAQAPALPPEGEPLAPGRLVRALRAPYAGDTGRVIEVLTQPAILPNGIRAPAAQVELEEHGPATIPLANLEALQ